MTREHAASRRMASTTGWPPPPYGPPPGGVPQYSGQQPPGFPQGPWPQQPAPPPKGNSIKWLLVAIAVLLVIVATIGATLLFTRDGDGDASGPPAPGVASDIASANDTGPVSIITDEPTCDAYIKVNDSVAALETQGWGDLRDNLGPRSTWTPQQQSEVEEVAKGIRNATGQLVALAKQTPHRVMRELYGQYIAYGRAYADSIPDYEPSNNRLADVNVAVGNALAAICTAIDNGAANRSLIQSPIDPPTEVAPVGDPANPERFLISPNPLCASWIVREGELATATADWANLDGNIPGTQWSPEQRATQEAADSALAAFGERTAAAGKQSGNPVVEDFSTLSAMYLQAYTSAGSGYTAADSWLSTAALRLSNIITHACGFVAE